MCLKTSILLSGILLYGCGIAVVEGDSNYYGKRIGDFVGGSAGGPTAHDVNGTVYAIDDTRLWITGFTYDGAAPDAFIWAGKTESPDPTGDIIPIEYPRKLKLAAYDNQDVMVRLPKGKLISDYKWISIWCRDFGANFAQVLIPDGFVAPSEYLITAQDGSGEPAELGFTPRVHQVHADKVYIIDTQRFRIENLDYDGNGPNANYWIGMGDTPNADGWPAWDENWSAQNIPENGESFNQKDVIITIPPPYTVHDIGNIGLWCITFTQDFGHLDIPDLTDVDIPPYVEDQGPYYGADLGAFSGDGSGSPSLHGVDGTVFVIDDTRIQIIGFSYDGQGPDAFVYVGSTDSPSGDGMIASVDGSSEKLGGYDNEDIIVTLPTGTSINDFKWISIWCRQAVVNFGHVWVPSGFQPPSEHNLDQQLGKVPLAHAVDATAVVIVDDKTIRIEGLDYDGNAPDTFYWSGPGWSPDSNGWILSDSVNGEMILPNDGTAYNDKTVILTMPEGYSVFDAGHIGLWCRLFGADFGHVKIPPRSQLNIPPTIAPTPDSDKGKIEYSSTNGSLIGSFPPTSVHGVMGDVYAIDDSRLRLIGFSYDGLGPDAYIWAGKTESPDSTGEIIPIDYGRKVKLGAYDNQDVVVRLPKGKLISDYKWISIWCRMAVANFGHVMIPDGFVAPSEYLIRTQDGSGEPAKLGFTPRVHQVHADKVYIIDTQRFRIENLDYDGNGPNANYWIGMGDTPNADGWPALDENWSDQNIPENGESFNQKTVIITIPLPYTVHDIGYIGLWCIDFTQDFGHLDIPDLSDVYIPPYVEDQGPYYGADLGAISGDGLGSPTQHGVDGTVFVIDDTRIQIIGFSYDGQGPDAFVYVGSTESPSGDGMIASVDGSTEKLGVYNNEDIIVTLPTGTSINDFKWISIWCRQAGANFGHVFIDGAFQAPAEHNLQQMLGFTPPLHGVTADAVYIVDVKTIRIENLNYDGSAPDTHYWAGVGVPDSNGFILLDELKSDMKISTELIDKTVTIFLPEDKTVFDIDYLSLWCRQAAVDFGHVTIPPRSQLNVPPHIPVVQVQYYGSLIGKFPPTSVHGVAGEVYAIDDSRLWLIGFSYDGLGPDAYIWAGKTESPDSTGEIIPIDYGRKVKLAAYDNQDVVVRLPKGKLISDYKWISIWCRMAVVNFGHVVIPDGFVTPSEYLISAQDGSGEPSELGFTPRVHQVHADKVYIIDTQRFRIENLDYDGNGPNANYWIGMGDTPNADGWPALDENWSAQNIPENGESFNQKTVIITIPSPYTVHDIGYIGLWCIDFTQDFGHLDIPDLTDVYIPPYVEDQGPYYGADLGPFSGDGSGSPTLHAVDGTVFVIDDTRIQIIGFSYDGQGPDAFVYLGSTDSPSGDGMIASVDGSSEKLGVYNNEDIIVTLPTGTSINDFKWISIWCRQAVANFGHVFIDGAFQAPAEHNLQQMLGFTPPLHGVTADAVYIVDEKTIRIENLNYDGSAPDTHYWAGVGVPDSNGFILLDELKSDMKISTELIDKTVTIFLPEDKTVFDIDYLSLWCRQAAVDFGHVTIPPRSQLNVPPHIPVVQVQYYGSLIGKFPPTSVHGVAGEVYAIDDSRLWLIGFSYDGLGPDAYIWAGKTESPDSTGEIIPIDYGRKVKLAAYDNQDVVVRLPKGKLISDYKWISIWCRMAVVNFGHVVIPDGFVTPSEYLISAQDGSGEPAELGFTPRVHQVHADKVYIIDTQRFRIENLDYDGNGPNANYWIGMGDTPNADGWPALDENWSDQNIPENGESFNQKTVIITIPQPYTVHDIGYIGLWCITFTQDFGHLDIPDLTDVYIPPYVEDQGPYYGADLGPFSGDGLGSPTLHAVDGTVFVIDDTRIQIIGFSYDGQGPDAFVYVGSTDSPSGDGMIASVGGSSEKLGVYNNEDIIVTLPTGTSINDFKWISIWCRQAVVNFGHVFIDGAFQAPAEHNLQQMLGFTPPLHGVTADAVYIVDEKTIRIENLNYDGSAPDTHYWAGVGIPDSNGFIVLDEFKRDTKIGTELADKTVTIFLPEDKTVFDINYLSLWCRQAAVDFGHVTIPPRSQLNVPPYIANVMGDTYYGKLLGDFSLDGSPTLHGVSGTVYALDDSRLWVVGFSYDGQGPDAYLWVGTTDAPGGEGYIVPIETSVDKLGAYDNAEFVVTLPNGMTLDHYKWISVWCRQAVVNFGSILIPGDFVPPSMHTVGQPLGNDPPSHAVQADSVVILDTRRIQIINLSYDGLAPDTYYWAGKGIPDSNGLIVPPADGSDPMLPNDGTAIAGKTVTLLLPEGITVFDIDYIGLWCKQAEVNFGHVEIPAREDLNIPPYYFVAGPEDGVFQNCEVLAGNKFHVSWTIEGATIAVQLQGMAEPNTYLGFGISGSDTRTSMIGADITAGWIDQNSNQGMVEDYYLSAYGQCIVSSGLGACPDTISSTPGDDSVTMISSSYDNGITTVSYRRLLNTGDTTTDRIIRTDQPMYIAWGIGPINPAGHTAKHRQRTVGSVAIDFGRESSTCPPLSTGAGPDLTPWVPADIVAGNDITTFTATMGQAGGVRGYEGITGRSGWGIAWYLNDEIIPVLTLTRGVTYTFRVSGGDNPGLSAQYHPFYITDDPDGGFVQQPTDVQEQFTIFAGPTEGPLCSWESKPSCSPNDFNNFAGYRDNCLEEQCAAGDPGILTWTPDDNTPDLVYYHCYTHRFLGWKIHVVDAPSLGDTYYGKLVGAFGGAPAQRQSNTLHGVAGKVYAIDDSKLWVREFSFDGQAPDTHFWVGNTPAPGPDGYIAVHDANNPDEPLGAYTDANLVVSLPEGTTFMDYTWISVWCIQAAVNFAETVIPEDFTAPAEQTLGMLGYDPPLHSVKADNVIIVNARQLRVENLFYDGSAPDTYYWAGSGVPDSNGFIVLDENMMPNMLPSDGTALQGVTVTVTLPEGKSVFDIDYFGLWCRQASADFGHVIIPSIDQLNVPPHIPLAPPADVVYNNCEVLLDNKFHASWAISGDMIHVQLRGIVEPGTYLGFGPSGSDTRTSMLGADTVIGWINKDTNQGMAEDYYLSEYGQCIVNAGSGVCPDTIIQPAGLDSVTLVSSSYENGITTVAYRRPLDTGDSATDKVMRTDQPMFIAWGIGPINPAGYAAKHRQRAIGPVTIDFGREGSTCPPLSTGAGPDLTPWVPANIVAGNDITTFTATMGQAGGVRGYEGITGRSGWGIAWYLNNEIIPVLTLTRGVTYTFRVSGGDNPSLSAQYHPFYITDDPDGGFVQQQADVQEMFTIFAGPTEGPLCSWESKPRCSPNDFNNFAGYRDNCLEEQCAAGDPGILTWTPDDATPDLVYYHCYTHRFLGWKIHVVDPSAPTPSPPPATPPPPVPSPSTGPGPRKSSCKVLIPDQFNAVWTRLPDGMIEMTLSARVEPGTYMAFGRSGSNSRTAMIGGDVIVAWIDKSDNTGRAVDYYLSAYSPCSGGFGACPDMLNDEGGTDDVSVVSSSFLNGVSSVTFRRPSNSGDAADKPIPIDRSIHMIWAIGPVGPEGLVSYHTMRIQGSLQIDFGRRTSPCPSLNPGGPTQGPPGGGDMKPWEQAWVGGEGIEYFRADIGLAGDMKGFEGITGLSNEAGIVWYINWELIPVIRVKRGVKYTFDVFGGDNPDSPNGYHPFYITNDHDGGFQTLTEEQRQGMIIYAGPVEGSLCEWVSNGQGGPPEDYNSFKTYRDEALVRNCNGRRNGVLEWTPDADTPQVVYYHSSTSPNIGWKIRVYDEFPDPPPTIKPRPPKGSATRSVISMATIIVGCLVSIALYH